jgi:hypothetical protein
MSPVQLPKKRHDLQLTPGLFLLAILGVEVLLLFGTFSAGMPGKLAVYSAQMGLPEWGFLAIRLVGVGLLGASGWIAARGGVVSGLWMLVILIFFVTERARRPDALQDTPTLFWPIVVVVLLLAGAAVASQTLLQRTLGQR